MRWLSLLLLVGCSVEAKKVAPDFECSGQEIPPVLPSTVRVDGVVLRLAGDVGIEGITVTGHAGDLSVEPVESDENGRFTFSHPLPGSATEDFIEGAAEGFLPTRAYPGRKVFEDSAVEIRMLPADQLMELVTDAGISIDPTLRTATFVLVRITDCNESPVAGATILKPDNAAALFYFRFLKVDLEARDTDASGLALIVGVPVDETNADKKTPVSIVGQIGALPLLDNTVEASTGGFVQTLARP